MQAGEIAMLKRLNKLSLFVPLYVLLAWTIAAPAKLGWTAYSDAALHIQYRLPLDWSHTSVVNTYGLKEIRAKSPDGFIHLFINSEPTRAGENISSNPAQLKRALEGYYRRLDAAENSQVDIKTRDIAVETINNLRGVVVELTVLIAVKDQAGHPFLSKLAGFFLLAQSGERRYRAIILCPLGKFTYNSALMNRVLNEIRAVGPAAEAETGPVTTINGTWDLSMGNIRLLLEIAGAGGKLRVRYQTTKGELVDVEEDISMRPTARGFLLVGSNPVHAGTLIPFEGYAPDELFFAGQTNGAFKVWVRDNVYVKEWQPLSINSGPN